MDASIDTLEQRMQRLSRKLDDCLDRARQRQERGQPTMSWPLDEMIARAEAAEAQAALQAQRCAALETKIADMGEALARAREISAVAPPTPVLEPTTLSGDTEELQRELQTRMLNLERVTGERDDLRRQFNELRSKTRALERERDDLRERYEKALSRNEELQDQYDDDQKKISRLDRNLQDIKRDLQTAERRTEHMRRKLRAEGRG